MPDSPTPWELLRRLEAQEHACESRAQAHVDRALYVSERRQMREDITALTSKLGEVNAELAEEKNARKAAFERLEEKQTQTRRWLLGTLVFPIGVAFFAVVIGGLL